MIARADMVIADGKPWPVKIGNIDQLSAGKPISFQYPDARVIKDVADKYGADELCSKIYDHGGGGGGMENTYGTGRLLFTGLQMKHVGIHNRPGYSSETWGTRDRGVHDASWCAGDRHRVRMQTRGAGAEMAWRIAWEGLDGRPGRDDI